MNDLPLAAFLGTEMIKRQLLDEPAETLAPVRRPTRRPILRIRVAVAEAFEWAAGVVAPPGYHAA
jgi:hypothetical protein